MADREHKCPNQKNSCSSVHGRVKWCKQFNPSDFRESSGISEIVIHPGLPRFRDRPRIHPVTAVISQLPSLDIVGPLCGACLSFADPIARVGEVDAHSFGGSL